MRIAVIRTGYVGLVSGACFADFGHVVTCVDKDAGKIGALRNGVMPIFEPGLDDLVAKNAQQARLFFETDAAPAVRSADAVFIAVGTPSRRGDGHADLSYVYEAAREIARELDGYTVVITKSTVPIGTGDEIERIIREAPPGCRCLRGVQSGVPARRRRHRGFQASGPDRGRNQILASTDSASNVKNACRITGLR